PDTARSVVVLPAPLAPISATTSPSATLRETPRSVRTRPCDTCRSEIASSSSIRLDRPLTPTRRSVHCRGTPPPRAVPLDLLRASLGENRAGDRLVVTWADETELPRRQVPDDVRDLRSRAGVLGALPDVGGRRRLGRPPRPRTEDHRGRWRVLRAHAARPEGRSTPKATAARPTTTPTAGARRGSPPARRGDPGSRGPAADERGQC